ncbi:MAG: ComEC/Rec2 family competence protein, partial [Deltaproteobacteria bacterium]|nr:ComEC/Rec2 family competence protein [Deltaproteobacteria bacterium]
MKAPAIVYVGVGCMAGAWAAQCLEPLPTLARWAAMSALVAAPIGWRWRWLLAAALVLSMVPGRAPPPAPARLSGQIVGPVLRAQRSVSASVATADGGRWRVRIGQMSNAQPVLAPCDRLELGGARAAGDELWVSASKVRHQPRRCASPWRWAHDARERLLDHLPAGRGFDLMAAVVLGDRSRLGADDSTLFRRAGVSHLIAVSGLHLAVVVGLLFALVRRLLAVFYPTSWPTRWAAGAALVGAVTFTMVTGAAVSTVRALAMVAVLLVPMLVGRRVEATVALAVAGMAVAVLHRELLANLGFQLSMAATAVLVMAVRRPPERTWWRWVEGAVLASAATFAVTAPIAGPRFGEVSPIALLSNLVVVPVIELGVLPLAFIGLSVASLWPGAGELLLRVGAAVAELALELIAWFARVEPWSWPTGWAWSAVALASAVAVARWGSIASRLALVVAGLAAA